MLHVHKNYARFLRFKQCMCSLTAYALLSLVWTMHLQRNYLCVLSANNVCDTSTYALCLWYTSRVMVDRCSAGMCRRAQQATAICSCSQLQSGTLERVSKGGSFCGLGAATGARGRYSAFFSLCSSQFDAKIQAIITVINLLAFVLWIL